MTWNRRFEHGNEGINFVQQKQIPYINVPKVILLGKLRKQTEVGDGSFRRMNLQ